MPTFASSTLSVTIERPWTEVYAFASDPSNIPQWAAGLGKQFEPAGDEWRFLDAGGRPARLRFSAKNPFGVLDHDVFPDGQASVHVAMRVVPNGDGAEVTFLLLRPSGMSDIDYQRDAAAVMKDLTMLKDLMEGAVQE